MRKNLNFKIRIKSLLSMLVPAPLNLAAERTSSRDIEALEGLSAVLSARFLIRLRRKCCEISGPSYLICFLFFSHKPVGKTP